MDIGNRKARKGANLEGLIEKFRVENQAFSTRVQKLKSKIDSAYNKFSGVKKG